MSNSTLGEHGNQIDWNNTLTGSSKNTIDLNMSELEHWLGRTVAVTNAVDVSPPTKEKDK